jgi:uncharacterized coiled-coil protein SlyX
MGKKFLVIAAFAALAILAPLVFAPAPATAGDLDELTALGDEGGGDKPAATTRKAGGGGGPSKAVKELDERIKKLEELLAKQPKPGEVNDSSIYNFLIPIYVAVAISIILSIIALVFSVGLRLEVRGFKAKVEDLQDAVTELKDKLEEALEEEPPPPAPAPGP